MFWMAELDLIRLIIHLLQGVSLSISLLIRQRMMGMARPTHLSALKMLQARPAMTILPVMQMGIFLTVMLETIPYLVVEVLICSVQAMMPIR